MGRVVPDLMADFLSTPEAATALRRSVDTLKRWRRDGGGPPAVRGGGRVLYRLSDLSAWIEAEARGGAHAPVCTRSPPDATG